METTNNRLPTPNEYISKFQRGDIVRMANIVGTGGTREYIVMKRDTKHNRCVQMIRRYRPYLNYYLTHQNKDDLELSSQNWRNNIKKGDQLLCAYERENMVHYVLNRDQDTITVQPLGTRHSYDLSIHSDNIDTGIVLSNISEYVPFHKEQLRDDLLHASVSVNGRYGKVVDNFGDYYYVQFYTLGNGWHKKSELNVEFSSEDKYWSGWHKMGTYSFPVNSNKYKFLLDRYNDHYMLNDLMCNDEFRSAINCPIHDIIGKALQVECCNTRWDAYHDYTRHISNHEILGGYTHLQMMQQDPNNQLSYFSTMSISQLRKAKRLEARIRAKRLIKTQTHWNGEKIIIDIYRPDNYKIRWHLHEDLMRTYLVNFFIKVSSYPLSNSSDYGNLEEKVREYGRRRLPNIIIVDKSPTKIPLLPFQEQIVDEMIQREKLTWNQHFKWSTNEGIEYNMITGIPDHSSGLKSGGILGLDVGLGKTICTLGLVVKSGGKTLVVCKLSLIDQWIKETRLFTNLTIGEIHGKKKVCNNDPDIIFTTYGTLVSHYKRGGYLRRDFDRIVFDESHTLKSTGTTLDACIHTTASKRWCLSATPFRDGIFKNILYQMQMMNVIGMTSSVVSSVVYNPYCTRNEFIANKICDTIIRPRVPNVINCRVEWQTLTYNITTPSLILYRALFKSILQKLRHMMQHTYFTRSYQKIKSYVNMLLICCNTPNMVPLYWWGELLNGETNSINIEDLNESLCSDASNFSKQVSADLAKLDQLTCCLCLEPLTRPTITKCNHMYCYDCIKTALQYKPNCPQCRQRVVEEDLREILTDPTDDTVDNDGFITIKDPLGRKVKLEKNIKDLYDTKEVSPKVKILEQIMQKRKQVIVFSQYNTALEYFHKQLGGSIITGRTTRSKRDKQMTEFTEGKTKVFFLSTKVADVGINLTTADTIVFLEPGMEKTVEQQAIGRVKRIGQTNDIKIYRILTYDGMEGKMYDIMREYNHQIRHIMNSGFSSATQSKKKKHVYLRSMLNLFKL